MANVGIEVEAGRLRIGDRIRTMRVGLWPGGPCTVVAVGPSDPNAPEICLYVRHDDPAVREEHGDEMGCFDYEAFKWLPELLVVAM